MRELFSERYNIMKKVILRAIVGLFVLLVFLGLLALGYWLRPTLIGLMYTCFGGVFVGHLIAKFTIWLCKKLGL